MSIPEPLRIWLRWLFRQTPPQREDGWVRLSVELPAETKDRPHRLVEMYDSRDDSIVQVYAWSLPATLQDDRRRLFWKEITPETWRGRGLAYFERSRRVFG